jgi:excinuclease UvrABC helicase subunit UvrB
VNNNYAVPNNLVYSFSPQGTIGEQFTIAPNQYVFIDVLPAQYNRFQVSFIDQNFRPVAIQDPNMIIQFVISEVEDNLGL